MEYTKTNYVITVKTSGANDVKSMYFRHRVGVVKPNYGQLTIKTVNPKATIIIFSTGNITIMGSHTLWGVKYALHKLQGLFPELVYTDIHVGNVVTTFNMTSKIDLLQFFKAHEQNSICNLDIFPSCSYHVQGTSVKANLFSSGNIILVGCTDDDMIVKMMETEILPQIYKQ